MNNSSDYVFSDEQMLRLIECCEDEAKYIVPDNLETVEEFENWLEGCINGSE